MSEHVCNEGGMCLSPDHRSEDLYQIGGLRDDIDGRKIIEDMLADVMSERDAKQGASAIIARLAHADPPILLCRLYEVF